MTFYQRISPLTPPQDFGVDAQGRAVLSFDAVLTKRVSDTALEEVYGLVSGFLPSGQVIVTSKASIPDSVTVLTLRESTGLGPIFDHNSTLAWERPGVRLTARSPNYRDARVVARAVYAVLVAVTNRDVAPATIP